MTFGHCFLRIGGTYLSSLRPWGDQREKPGAMRKCRWGNSISWASIYDDVQSMFYCRFGDCAYEISCIQWSASHKRRRYQNVKTWSASFVGSTVKASIHFCRSNGCYLRSSGLFWFLSFFASSNAATMFLLLGSNPVFGMFAQSAPLSLLPVLFWVSGPTVMYSCRIEQFLPSFISNEDESNRLTAFNERKGFLK